MVIRETIGSLLALLFCASIVVILVQLIRRRWKSSGIWGGIAFVSLVACGIIMPAQPQAAVHADRMPKAKASRTRASAKLSTPAAGPTPTLKATAMPTSAPTIAPTPKPPTRAEEKREFLYTVDESISGSRIEGNPYKFIGENIDLHCTVDSIPARDFFNAACGSDPDGSSAIIVILADATQLEQGQRIRVIGTVVTPIDGNNAYGGDRSFPTVKARFMQ